VFYHLSKESIPNPDKKEKLIVFIDESKNINECESASVGTGTAFNLCTKRYPNWRGDLWSKSYASRQRGWPGAEFSARSRAAL
jgi:hypothetical protein